eukprot:3551291-Prymnesium_polylepis.1
MCALCATASPLSSARDICNTFPWPTLTWCETRRRRAAATISTLTQRALPCRRDDPPARPGA